MAASKQQQLVDSIVDGIKPLLDDQTKATSVELANLSTMLAGIVARLEVLEAGAPAGGAKRQTRGARQTGGGAGAGVAKGAASGDARDKVKNAMLFCRWAMAHDDDFREKYEHYLPTLAEDEKVAAKDEGSEERKLLEGSQLWKSCLTEDEKKDVRAEFTRWKEALGKEALAKPLDADDGKDEADE